MRRGEESRGPWRGERAEEALEFLRTALPGAEAGTRRVLAAIESEIRPDDGDLRSLTEIAAAFDAAARLLPEAGPSLPELERAAARAEQRARDAHRVAALAALSGPARYAGSLAEVRAAAAAGPSDDLLLACDLLDAVAIGSDDEEALVELAEERWPESWRRLIWPVSKGIVTLAPAPPRDRPTSAADSAEPGAPPQAVSADAPAITAPRTEEAAPSTAETAPPDRATAPDAPQPPGAPPTDGLDDAEAAEAAEAAALDAELAPLLADLIGTPEEEVPAPSSTATSPSEDPPPSKPAENSESRTSRCAQDSTAPQETARPADAGDREEAGAGARREAADAAARAGGLRQPGGTPPAADPVVRAEPPERQPAPAPPVEAGEDSAAATLGPDAARAEAAALTAGRVGLAAWIRAAGGRPDAEARARRCATLSDEITDLYGEPATRFQSLVNGLSARTLKDDRGGQLLAWGACIRAGVVAPTQESTTALEDLAPAVSAYPALTALGEAFARAARSGAYLEPGLSGPLRDRTQAGERRAEIAAAAEELLRSGPKRSINYAQATVVWKMLLQRTARLGALLTTVAEDDASRLGEVSEELRALAAHGAVDRLIDETTRRSAMSTRNKIIATARRKLAGWVGEALDLAEHWSEAVRAASSFDGDGWAAARLTELREELAPHRAGAEAEFAALTADSSAHAPAARIARVLVQRVFDLLDGARLDRGGRVPVHQLLHRDLLLVPGLAVEAATLEPAGVPALADLSAVALGDEPDWAAAFTARAACGDHEGTLAVVQVLESLDGAASSALRLRREELVVESRARRDARAERIRDRLARRLRDGVLSEDEAAGAEQALQGLCREPRVDFGAIDADLDRLELHIDRLRDDSIGREAANLAALAQQDARVAAVADRISTRIQAGDLTTALEFLAQVQENGVLPERREPDEDFARFFPAFPRAIARMVAQAGGSRARRQDSDEVITQLHNAVKAGREVTEPALAGLLAEAGIDIRSLRTSRMHEAAECLRLWKALAQGPKSVGSLRTPIETVLRAIGAEGVQRDGEIAKRRAWVQVDDVRLIGSPLLPAFGSKISPSGGSLRLLLVWDRPGPLQLLEYLKDQPKDQTILVLYFGVLSDTLRRELATESRRRPGPVAAVLDEAAVCYLALAPGADWSLLVRLLSPFTLTNPYAPTGGVPDEMFMGRSEPLREVLDPRGPSFVYGGRQFGKSALLRKAESEVRRSDPHRVVVFETIQMIGRSRPAEALWPLLGDVLVRSGITGERRTQREEVVRSIRTWIEEDRRRQLLILLDEADWFLSSDADRSYFENVMALRDLMEHTERRVKVVFAGLHQTARFEGLPNQPLAHLGQPVAVGPLESQAAFDLLVQPLDTLGFKFAEDLAARVIAEANNAPALVQLFASALLDRLNRVQISDRPIPYRITREDVDAVWRDAAFRKGVTDRFEWTLNLDKRYKVIAYSVALKALEPGDDPSAGAGELAEMCRGWWERGFAGCTTDEFRGLLDECVNLGVLGVEGDRYRLRTPHILRLLGGSAAVEAELVKAEGYTMPDAFDAGAYRPPLDSGPCRSPLTGGQIAELMQERPVVHVISGSEALGQHSVAAALREERDRHQHQRITVRLIGSGDGRHTLKSAAERAETGGGYHLIVADLGDSGAEEAVRTMAEAVELVGSRSAARGGTFAVAVLVPPRHAHLWTGLPEDSPARLMELRPFSGAGIRQWIHEESSGLVHGMDATELLRITGGWPSLLDMLARETAPVGMEMEHAQKVCAHHLERSARQFVCSTGVLDDRTVEAAWAVLARQDERGPATDLAVWLEVAGESEQPALRAAELAAAGYADHLEVVETLRVLGALRVRPVDGTVVLECEPVLAAAWAKLR